MVSCTLDASSWVSHGNSLASIVMCVSHTRSPWLFASLKDDCCSSKRHSGCMEVHMAQSLGRRIAGFKSSTVGGCGIEGHMRVAYRPLVLASG